MEIVSIYVLVESKLMKGNEISDRVVNVTLDLEQAEAHAAQGVEFEYKEFRIPTELFVRSAESTEFLKQMREFKQAAREVQGLIVDSSLKTEPE